MTPKLVDERYVEETYGIPRSTLQKRRFDGRPPAFIKIGRRCYYKPEAIEQFIAANEKRPNSEHVGAGAAAE